jgi:hypothetical protein
MTRDHGGAGIPSEGEGDMTKVLTQLAILPMVCLPLLLAPGCGDSLANGKPVDAEKAFALSEAEALSLTANVWKKQAQERYTSFLEINKGRSGGFLCNNDGKSVSGMFSFLEVDGDIVMTGPAGHDADVKVVENLRFEGANLVINGVEKGTAYAFTYLPIPGLPDICKRIKAGEEPTFDEYQASWDPEK